jgi:hypothetical protein
MSNPYNKISPKGFLIKTFARVGQETIFLVDLAGENGFDACVFRDHLARFILDEFEGPSHLGHDTRYIRDLGANLALMVRETADIVRLRENFRVL